MAKTLKQLQADEKRKKLKVRKLDVELKKEKTALGKMTTLIAAAKKKEALAKKKKAAPKKSSPKKKRAPAKKR